MRGSQIQRSMMRSAAIARQQRGVRVKLQGPVCARTWENTGRAEPAPRVGLQVDLRGYRREGRQRAEQHHRVRPGAAAALAAQLRLDGLGQALAPRPQQHPSP